MATTNHDRVSKALGLLNAGLRPFVERELKSVFGENWGAEVKETLSDTRLGGGKGDALQDVAVQLVIMDRHWGAVFRKTLGKAERSLVNELLEVRHRWAHQNLFSSDDADRALDSIARLLTAISAPEADEVGKMKMELRRLMFDEQVRSEKRKSAGTAIESAAAGTLKPWREVVTPHKDVASGRYQQAEFAADLWQVHLGEGTDEYRNPVEFFRRTYLTESLKAMLVGAVRRLSGQGGDPVVQLQTNFGGGKTHSMLALYHLFSGVDPERAGGHRRGAGRRRASRACPAAQRVVLVGNKISPGNPVTKPDGTVVRTLWGELAWQLGGKKAFARIQADDEKATSPGDVLRELFVEYGPCLILIDEWVAYARQLHDQSDLPAGGFETQFTFAQVLTESAKLASNCLLVISLPASDTSGSPHTQADNVEVGGQRGREALDRLRNVVGRVESSWRPASAEEGFEIVRRRLFEPISDPAQYQGPRCRGAGLRRLLSHAGSGVSARVPHGRLREAHQGRLSHPPGDLRPALHRLVDPGEVPAHARRVATDGGGHPQPLGEGGQEPADPAGEHLDRRQPRPVRADALPLGQLGAGDREGRRRPQLAAPADGQRRAEPRQILRLPACGTHHLPGLGAADPGRAPRPRRPAGEARLRDARRIARRSSAMPCGGSPERRPISIRMARAIGIPPSPP